VFTVQRVAWYDDLLLPVVLVVTNLFSEITNKLLTILAETFAMLQYGIKSQ